MLHFVDVTPEALAEQLATRVRALRLRRAWSRAELAARAGVALPTLRKFEDSGQISLVRLLKLAAALDALGDFEHVMAGVEPPRSLADIEALAAAPRRQRGRTIARPSP